MTGYQSKKAAAQDKLTVDRTQVEQWLEALLDIINGSRIDSVGNRNDDGLIDHNGHHDFKKRIKAANDAITAAREALAQPDLTDADRKTYQAGHNAGVAHHKQATKREWVSLTDDEVQVVLNKVASEYQYGDTFARAIEAKLKEKNT